MRTRVTERAQGDLARARARGKKLERSPALKERRNSLGRFKRQSEIVRLLLAVIAALLASMALLQNGLAGEEVDFSTSEARGTIIINTNERKLYFVLADETAIRYRVAVPRRGGEWFGRAKVTGILFNPDWAPPPPVRADHPDLPDLVPAGAPNNPVGARAILLDRAPVAIHGTSMRMRRSVGTAASYGCIRMLSICLR